MKTEALVFRAARLSRSARATGLTRVLAVEAGLEYSFHRPSGGRTWWAQFEFTRINIRLTILPKKFEDLRESGAFMFTEAA